MALAAGEGASAVALSSLLHYKRMEVGTLKAALAARGVGVRA